MVLKKTLANYQWAIGVEHEMHIFLLNRNIVKHYNIIETENACRYILENCHTNVGKDYFLEKIFEIIN